MSSPASILSEMHNKKLLQPLLNIQIPLLLSLLPSQLQPAPAPHAAPLPSTPAQREAADILNSRNEMRRGLYWDWNENLITLLWCCAESNTKILTSLNAGGQGIIDYLMAFLESGGLGLEEDGDDMEGVKGGKKGKKVKKEASKKERVPLFVAVAAGRFSLFLHFGLCGTDAPRDRQRKLCTRSCRPTYRPRLSSSTLRSFRHFRRFSARRISLSSRRHVQRLIALPPNPTQTTS